MKPPWPKKWLEAASFVAEPDPHDHRPAIILDALESVGAIKRPEQREWWLCLECSQVADSKFCDNFSSHEDDLIKVREVLEDGE